MDSATAAALIRRCVEEDRFAIREHVFERMEERGLTLPDLLAIVAAPEHVRSDGYDDYGRERWFLRSRLSHGLEAELLVVVDDPQHATFFTIYWV